jgi:hypothetical protein
MLENYMNNCFILGILCGIIATVASYFHKKNTKDTQESDTQLYVKIFLLVSVLTCGAVYAGQYTKSKAITHSGGSLANIHTGSPSF